MCNCSISIAKYNECHCINGWNRKCQLNLSCAYYVGGHKKIRQGLVHNHEIYQKN